MIITCIRKTYIKKIMCIIFDVKWLLVLLQLFNHSRHIFSYKRQQMMQRKHILNLMKNKLGLTKIVA